MCLNDSVISGKCPSCLIHEEKVARLLAQLKDREEKLEAVVPLLRRLRTAHVGKRGYCEGCRASWPCVDAVDIDRILKGGD